MPSCRNSTPPDPPGPPWTVARARAVLTDAATELQEIVYRLEDVHEGLPRPADLAEREEGRLPYDVTTDLLATIECVLEDNLRPAIESLERSAATTDEELAQQHRQWLKKWRRS
jgi:hypothetical protein